VTPRPPIGTQPDSETLDAWGDRMCGVLPQYDDWRELIAAQRTVTYWDSMGLTEADQLAKGLRDWVANALRCESSRDVDMADGHARLLRYILGPDGEETADPPIPGLVLSMAVSTPSV
jgi:hypothetical protein